MKTGRLAKTEQDFIKFNYKRLTYTELAAHLDRSVDSIRTFVEKKLGVNVTTIEVLENKAEFDIKKKPYWKDLTKQFTEEELETFIYYWTKIVAQFKDDILPTEEMQIIHACKIEIMANRTLSTQNRIKDDIEILEQTLNMEKEADVSQRNHQFILDLERQIATLRAAQDESSKEYLSLVNRHSAILRDMKSTRDQRLKKIESSKENFSSWMMTLINNVELRKNLGLYMEKMRLSMIKERDRLSEYHTYVDGSIDRPILNADTVSDDDAKEL